MNLSSFALGWVRARASIHANGGGELWMSCGKTDGQFPLNAVQAPVNQVRPADLEFSYHSHAGEFVRQALPPFIETPSRLMDANLIGDSRLR